MLQKVIFICSHPIQYFAPMFAYFEEQGLPLEVWYCSDESVRGEMDIQFNTKVKWDIPLLEGYSYRFFKNNSKNPSINNGFWGLNNKDIKEALKAEKPCLIIVPGWSYSSYLNSIRWARRYGHKVALRGESPLNQELMKPKWKLFIRSLFFKWIFKRVDYCLYIGSQNKAFYKYYSIPENQCFFTPYAVDNKRFQCASESLKPLKESLKISIGIPANHLVILYSGKYIHKKKPLDLLNAFSKLKSNNISLVMVGDGELKESMHQFIKSNNLSNVYLTGFINQSKITEYYAVGDIFVMCSGFGETWGLSVNEAMNFSLPIVLSDTPGSAYDLILEGENGFIYKTGDVEELTNCIKELILKNVEIHKMGLKSKEIISNYSYSQVYNTIKKLLLNTSN
jgi:glycosyltransferase involved in cell wall biosynthesis